MVNEGARRWIAVFGSGNVTRDSSTYAAAKELGRLIVEAGCGVVNGGYGGVMEASARGAQEAGGRALGVLASGARGGANPFLSETLEAGGLVPRLDRLLELGSAYIWLEGGTGTLLELTAAWHLALTTKVGAKPCVLLGSDWPRVVDALIRTLSLDSTAGGVFRSASSVKEAVSLAVEAPSGSIDMA